MPWYSYIFFAFALLAFFLGAPAYVKRRNGIGFIYSLILCAGWALLGAWTGGLLS